jgi:hypothetical protein
MFETNFKGGKEGRLREQFDKNDEKINKQFYCGKVEKA